MKTIQSDSAQKNHEVTKWVEQFGDELYSWAYYKTYSASVSEDLVQETFMAAWQAYENFQGRSEVKTWLFAILNNKIKDHHRKKVYDSVIFTHPSADHIPVDKYFDSSGNWKEEHRPTTWTGETTHLMDNQAFTKTLQGCLQRLPEVWFSALQLKYLEEKGGKEICQELRISPSNFWQILHRAKVQLRDCLEVHWFKQ